MNFKRILILSILLMVMTISAVGASQNISDCSNDTSVDSVLDDHMYQIDEVDCNLESGGEIDEGVFDEIVSISKNNESFEKLESSDDIANHSENIKSQHDEVINSGNHFGYWVFASNMLDLNLSDLSKHGVSDLFLNFFAYEKYNQSIVDSAIAHAGDEGIKVHIWAQIFYRGGKWFKPVINGTVNQEYFDAKIDELKRYANMPGVDGIHFDYLRFAGSTEYNSSAQQNPGGVEAICEFVNQATDALRKTNPNLTLSVALMPEIDYLKIDYGDDYDYISEKMDVVVPMIYTGNFRQNSTWVKQTTQWFVNNSKGAEVWTGLQGYTVNDIDEEYISNSPHSQMAIEIKSSLDGGSNGALIFRFGACENIDFVNLPIDQYEFSTFNNLDYLISCSKHLASLNQDFIFNATHDVDYVNGVGIHRNNLIIDGNNHVIDGGSLARMFNVTGKNVTFRNIVFVNGNSKNGGVLHITGSNVRIINCTFIDNVASEDGGAIFIKAANASIINSKFLNNKAIYNAAVYMNSVNGKLFGSYFENNIANISAGAVGWAKKENGLIDNCTFINNSAHNEGGGAIFWNQGLNGKIINSKFENNYGNFSGGAIFWAYGENSCIFNCSFKNNKGSVSGGAIFFESNNISIEYCQFMNNSANYGGGLFILGAMDIDNTIFDDNHALYYADEILLVGNGTVRLNNVTSNNMTPVFYQGIVINANNVSYGNSLNLIVEFLSNGSSIPVNLRNVSVVVNNKIYTGDVVDGKAKIEISNLDVGVYTAYVLLEGGANYTSTKQMVNFEVINQTVIISADNKNYVINYGGKYSVIVSDADGKAVVGENVTFTFNGKNIGVFTTDTMGIATVSLTPEILKTAKTGNKNLVVKFANSNYNITSKTVVITINKEGTKIIAKKKSFKKSIKIKKYVVFLKNSKNKPIKKIKTTFKIKGKTYKATTNSKGKAIFKITKLTKKGNHIAKITFKGNEYYKSQIKKSKIKIK